MKINEIRELTTPELTKKVSELREELFNLNFELNKGTLENVSKIRAIKKTIARIKTVIRKREIEG